MILYLQWIWLFISVLKTKIDNGRCLSTICPVISINVKTGFAFSEIMAQVSFCILQCSFFNNDSDFFISTKVGLSHLFLPWLISSLFLKQRVMVISPVIYFSPYVLLAFDFSWGIFQILFLKCIQPAVCVCLPLQVIFYFIWDLILCNCSLALYYNDSL